jgi:hypothetical protein
MGASVWYIRLRMQRRVGVAGGDKIETQHPCKESNSGLFFHHYIYYLPDNIPHFGLKLFNIHIFWTSQSGSNSVHSPIYSYKKNTYLLPIYNITNKQTDEWCLLGCYAVWLL